MYEQRLMGKSGYIDDASKQITFQQFIDNLKYQQLVGNDFKSGDLQKLYEKQKRYHENKYNISRYKN